MSYGPNPWRQAHWDWRAAGNFICGGAGGGLIVFTTIAGVDGTALAGLMLAGLVLIGLGLFCVWLEIGRPLRALRVFANPRTSWMTREALAAALLFPVGLAAAAAVPGSVSIAAALALTFMYCQGRMLQAAKGIPAWRGPLVPPLTVASGLADGGGVFFLLAPLHGNGTTSLLVLFGALVLLRMLVWLAYLKQIAVAAPRAHQAFLRADRVLRIAGTLVPLAVVVAIGAGVVSGTPAVVCAALAGLAAAMAGAALKYALVTRAAFNQGFALQHLPVRGTRR
jgi:phenylacetyl-CoA:acceptor oxidoreductase 26-kDa subunit